MPNHITNILTAPKIVLDALASKESPADFETLIPRPKDIIPDGVSCHVISLAELICGKVALKTQGDLENGGASKLSDSDFELFVTAMRSYRSHGAFYWYDWNIEHWGTKWNAYDAARESDTCLKFDTAWSAPHPVIELLASKFPDKLIEHNWADEDVGHNCGSNSYRLGSVTPVKIKDPIDFALTVKGSDRE